jgi:FKBP-type peptidyl-prolyl cis-trans isomerase FkpA
MKKFLGSLLIVSCLLLNSCGKSDTGCQPIPVANEKVQLQAFCTANSITASENPNGFLYEIISNGSGPAITIANTVSVVYTGKLMDGTVFTAVSTSQDIALSGVIDGWKLGIPLVRKGGHIKLVIPSALGYSCGGNLPAIPGNAPIYFDITVNDVK